MTRWRFLYVGLYKRRVVDVRRAIVVRSWADEHPVAVPAPRNISVKRLKFRLSGSARKSQKRFRDTPTFKIQAVLARIQPFQRSNERSERGDHPVRLSGSHTNIDRSRYRYSRPEELGTWTLVTGSSYDVVSYVLQGYELSKSDIGWERYVPGYLLKHLLHSMGPSERGDHIPFDSQTLNPRVRRSRYRYDKIQAADECFETWPLIPFTRSNSTHPTKTKWTKPRDTLWLTPEQSRCPSARYSAATWSGSSSSSSTHHGDGRGCKKNATFCAIYI
eukprot:COSAG06_NODE_9130_length_1978_cov_4.634912_3_plen_275_part_00